MKIKFDLTTNSSNQSFVIGGGRQKKIIDVAKEMLEIFFDKWKEEEPGEEHPKKTQTIEWLEKNPDFEGNIVIPWTCNYATFIFDGDWVSKARGNQVIVDTCNNESWESNGLDIEYYLDPNFDHNKPTDKFLDLNDFKLKTRLEFETEERKRLGIPD